MCVYIYVYIYICIYIYIFIYFYYIYVYTYNTSSTATSVVGPVAHSILLMHAVLDSRERAGYSQDACRFTLKNRQGNGAGNDRNPAQGQAHQQNRRNWEWVGGCWLATKFVGQQKQCHKEGIPEGGRIPKHRDTTRLDCFTSDGLMTRWGVESHLSLFHP